MKLIKWKYKPSSNCPVQAEGWFLNHYFYFRARWDYATIEFAKTEWNWEKSDIIYSNYNLWHTKPYKAGWLPKWFCLLLIYKGCFLFWINQLKTKK